MGLLVRSGSWGHSTIRGAWLCWIYSGFQGFGHDVTDAEGAYSFRTIKPVPYSGRTPHIHVKVLVSGLVRYYLESNLE